MSTGTPLSVALHDENLFALMLERIPLRNLPPSPWEGCAAFQGIRAAGAQFFESASPDNELYEFLYPQDRGWRRLRLLWIRQCKKYGNNAKRLL